MASVPYESPLLDGKRLPERVAYGPLQPDALKDEERLVLLVEPEIFNGLDYVREKIILTSRPRSKPARVDGLLGYAALRRAAVPDPESGLYRQRVFFQLPHDRNNRRDNGTHREGSPLEAVDPATVRARVPGFKTHRSQGKPVPASWLGHSSSAVTSTVRP
ncbi:DUF6009 family protein [Streptomyces sp. NPDC048527]|uniref:DUF6009 family protein n=1 Tax=Streptomyces sp. NPDC048527 TaxID=3365568 RepID=UPI00371C1762